MTTVVNLGACQILAWVAWAHKMYSRSVPFHYIVSFYFISKSVFRTQSNIYNGAFLRK